jgi:threonine synthase
VAVAQLVEKGVIARSDRVVILATAGGLKDPARAAASMPPVPVVTADIDATLDIIHRAYGFDAAMAA